MTSVIVWSLRSVSSGPRPVTSLTVSSIRLQPLDVVTAKLFVLITRLTSVFDQLGGLGRRDVDQRVECADDLRLEGHPHGAQQRFPFRRCGVNKSTRGDDGYRDGGLAVASLLSPFYARHQ